MMTTLNLIQNKFHDLSIHLHQRLRFLDVETNIARGVLFLISAEYSVVMCEAWPRTLVTKPWLRLSMI